MFGLSCQTLCDDLELSWEDDRSYNHVLQRLAVEEEVEICVESDIAMASTSDELFVEVHNSSTSLMDMCKVVGTHDVSDNVGSCKGRFSYHKYS